MRIKIHLSVFYYSEIFLFGDFFYFFGFFACFQIRFKNPVEQERIDIAGQCKAEEKPAAAIEW